MEVDELCLNSQLIFEEGNFDVFDKLSKYAKNNVKKEILRQLNESSSGFKSDAETHFSVDSSRKKVPSTIILEERNSNILENVFMDVDKFTSDKLANNLTIEAECIIPCQVNKKSFNRTTFNWQCVNLVIEK